MLPKKFTKKHILVLFFSMFVLIGGLALTIVQSQQSQDQRTLAAGECTVSDLQMQIKTQEQELFDLINAYRTQNNLAVLTWSPALKKPAAWMSSDMLKTQKLSHTDSLGRTPEVRLPDCGFPLSTNYGENIANGAPTPVDILNAWKASPPHNQILLGTSYTQGAVAMEISTTNTMAYWTLDVGGTFNTNPTTTIGPPGIISPTLATGQPTVTVPVGTEPTIVAPTTIATLIPTQGTNKAPTPTSGPIGVDVQISLKVKIGGIGQDGNVTPKNLTRRVQASIYGVEEEPITTGNAFLTYDGKEYFTGIVRLGRLAQGVYLVKLSTDNSLLTLVKPEFQTLMIDRVNEMPAVTLYQGDITKDNVLNLDDYNAVLPCFQDKKCDTANLIDLNDDSVTDVKDYNLFLRSFSQQPGN